MTRLLTEEEIENMIDFIKPQRGIPFDSAMSIVNNIKERLRVQLRVQKVYPEIIPQLKEQLERNHQKTLIQPGESVGIICAQSIGQKNTQLTLNTFHKAGQSEKGMTAGVPRFQELLNATKEQRNVNCKIYFKDNFQNVRSLRNKVGYSITGLILKDVVFDIEVCINKKKERWYDSFFALYNYEIDFEIYKDCLSMKINMSKLYKHKLSMKKICEKINEEYEDIVCIFSPNVLGQIDIFVDTRNIELPEDRILFINHDNKNEIYLEECVQPKLEEFLICGIEGINEIYYVQEEDEWIVETDGSNYKKLLAHPDIDKTRTKSNDPWEILNILGVEATREFLIEEFMNIMEGINICHAKLLVDRMTFSGTVSSISRYTLRKEDSGPFGKASFEETMDNFLQAATSGDIENTNGVSASIICGKRAPIGTGMVDLKIDINKIINTQTVDSVKERKTDF